MDAAALGGRYSLLTHAVFFTSDLICDGVYHQPFREFDARSAAYEAAALTVREQADELDGTAATLARMDGSEIRAFWKGVQADNLMRLQDSWDSAYYRLKYPSMELPNKARRELESKSRRQDYQYVNGNSGERYADLTYWAIGALRDLNVSALHPKRHRTDDERSLKNEIAHTRALLRDIRDVGFDANGMYDGDLHSVIGAWDAQTRVRTRLFASDTSQRLRPLLRQPIRPESPLSEL